MNCQIKKVPLVFKRTHPKTNYEFFVALVDAIQECDDIVSLQESMYSIFSWKIKIDGILWQYGWDEKGMTVWFVDNRNIILFVECDTEEILDDI